MQGYSQWLEGWKRNGWKTGKKKTVANQDIWQIIDKLKQRKLDISVKWVKEHIGVKGNELADQLASIAAAKT